MKNHLLVVLFACFAFIVLSSCDNNQLVTDDNRKELRPKTSIFSDPNYFSGNRKAKAMVLGVFHFDNPGHDGYKKSFPFDILQADRQEELQLLIKRIEKYKPTKILVEVDRIESDSILFARYKKYLSGKFKINEKKSEVYQLAFKLGKHLGHQKLYASDADSDWFGAELDWQNYNSKSYMKDRGQLEKSSRYDYDSFYRLNDSLKTVQTLVEHLLMLNSPEGRLKDHQGYLTETILEGAGDLYIGADAVAKWYRRNLRIFSNAYDMTNFEEEERLLLIYGAGHVWQLRQFFVDSPDFEYIEANDYLSF